MAAWMDASDLMLPANWSLDLDVAPEVVPGADPRRSTAIGDMDVHAGEPGGTVYLSWRYAPAWAHIDANEPRGTVHLSDAAICDPDRLFRSFLLSTMVFMLRRCNQYHVHAATAIDPAGQHWMLIGGTGTGKSTTTGLLASRGWQIGTDDAAFLSRSGTRTVARGIRRPIALRAGGAALLGAAGGVAAAARGKTEFDASDFSASWVTAVEPDYIVVTALGGDRTTLTPLSAPDLLKSLINNSPWLLFESQGTDEHLQLLTDLARQSRGFQANLAPDLFDAPGALADFLP